MKKRQYIKREVKNSVHKKGCKNKKCKGCSVKIEKQICPCWQHHLIVELQQPWYKKLWNKIGGK